MILSAIMRLNAAGFTGPLGGVRSALGGTIAKIAALTGGALTMAGAIAGVKNALDLGGELSDLSATTGIAVDKLMVLRQAMQDTGIGAEKVQMAVNMMQRSLANLTGSDQGNQVIQQLGLNLGELKKMDPTAQFETIGKAIGALRDPAQQTAASMAIFGRSGAELNTLFASPEAFDIARRSLGELPALMARNANLFDSISDSMGRVKMKGVGLFAGIAEGVAPALKGVMDQVDGMDFTPIGQKIGNALALGLQALREGKIGELAGLSLKIGFGEAINFLAGTLGNLSFWKGIGQMALAGFMGIGGALLKIFMTPITYLQAGMDLAVDHLFAAVGKIPGINKLLGLEGYTAATPEEALRYRQENGFFLKDAADASLGLAGDMAKAGAAALKDGLRSADVFDTSGMKDELGKLVGGLQAAVDATKAKLDEKFAGAPAGGAAAELKAGAKGAKVDIASDRLARVGGFLGGSGPLLDVGRRTANAAEKTARGVQKMVDVFSRGGAEPAAVWAT